MKVRIKFEPRDLWVGVFWRRTKFYPQEHPVITKHDWLVEVFVCLVPMLPIVFSFWRYRERNRCELRYVYETKFGGEPDLGRDDEDFKRRTQA